MVEPKVVHCRKELCDVYIGRPSKWGNPFTHKEGTTAKIIVASRERAVSRYRDYLRKHPELVEAAKKELRGKVLGCWCSPLACHGDVLVEVANE